MPRKTARSKKRTKRKKRKRPYKRDKRAHKVRRRKLHHKAEFRKEQEMTNYLLHQMLKTMSAPEGQYNYHPRHFTKDREYKFSSDRTKTFKQGFPSPDVNFWRPPGRPESDTWTAAPYRGNIYIPGPPSPRPRVGGYPIGWH